MIKILLIFFLFVSSSLSKELCITNFGKEICDTFEFSNGVIVKSKLQKDEIEKKLGLKKIRQIAFLKDSNIYLIDTNTPIKDYEEFKKLDFIEYSIPDIIQSKKRATFDIRKYQKDLKLKQFWSESEGEGVNIAIIDDGFNLHGEEFSDTKVIFSYDVDTKTLDASPKLDIDTHGTKVAGIIFAKHNGNEVEGIAPKANLIAIRQTTNTTSDTIVAFTVAKKAGADIINCSWNSPILLEPVYDVIKDISKETAVVFAAGNEHKKIEPFSTEASISEVITVGAIQKFSNYGDMIDFTLDSRVMSVGKNGSLVMFGGTSAAAPIISGLLALEKSNNMDKNISEIIHILKRDMNVR